MNQQQAPRKGATLPAWQGTNQPARKRGWKKAAYGVLVILIMFILLVGYRVIVQSAGVDSAHLPQFIQANFIGLDHITSISKYRSAAGHDFNDGTETCRSMKHYFAANAGVVTGDEKSKASVHPLDDGTDIPIYSPVDGTISSVASESTPIGKQVHIVPDSAPQFTIRLFHIWETDGIHGGIPLVGIGGSHVKAGQQIGVIPATQDVDISVEYGSIFTQRFVSFFDVMPDSLFAAYQARGLRQRSDVIISKEYRDSNPLECGGPEKDGFIRPANYSESADYVYLSGYVAPIQGGGGSVTGKTPTAASTDSAAQPGQSDVCSQANGSAPKPPGCK